MKLNLDLSLKRDVLLLSPTVARVQGDVELKVIAEAVTRGWVEGELVRALRDSELEGKIEIDGQAVDVS